MQALGFMISSQLIKINEEEICVPVAICTYHQVPRTLSRSEGLKLLNVPCDWVLSVCDLNINSLDVPRVTWLITMFVKVVTKSGLSLVNTCHVTWILASDWLLVASCVDRVSCRQPITFNGHHNTRCNSITWWTLIDHSWLRGSKSHHP